MDDDELPDPPSADLLKVNFTRPEARALIEFFEAKQQGRVTDPRQFQPTDPAAWESAREKVFKAADVSRLLMEHGVLDEEPA